MKITLTAALVGGLLLAGCAGQSASTLPVVPSAGSSNARLQPNGLPGERTTVMPISSVGIQQNTLPTANGSVLSVTVLVSKAPKGATLTVVDGPKWPAGIPKPSLKAKKLLMVATMKVNRTTYLDAGDLSFEMSIGGLSSSLMVQGATYYNHKWTNDPEAFPYTNGLIEFPSWTIWSPNQTYVIAMYQV
jgi:hypothetical protein